MANSEFPVRLVCMVKVLKVGMHLNHFFFFYRMSTCILVLTDTDTEYRVEFTSLNNFSKCFDSDLYTRQPCHSLRRTVLSPPGAAHQPDGAFRVLTWRICRAWSLLRPLLCSSSSLFLLCRRFTWLLSSSTSAHTHTSQPLRFSNSSVHTQQRTTILDF